MSQPFKCPSCGGPLEYDGGDITVRCEFCSNSVVVPEELRESFELPRVAVQAAQQPYVTFPRGIRATRLKGCSPFILALLIVVPVLCAGSTIAFLVFSGFREQVTRIVTGNKKASPREDKSTSGFTSEVLKFGSEGIGPGQFKDARTVAVDGAGHIFAADYTGGRVQVFDSNGQFLTQWMVDPKFPLLKLAADRKGIVYIVQRGDINRYDGMTGQTLGKVQTDGKSFDDVIVTLDGGLIAVQNNEDLVRFDAGGRIVSTIKKSVSGQSGNPELAAKVAVDGLGNVYAMGRFNSAVFKFAPDGKFITRIGGEGNEAGLFRALKAIAVDGQGRIYVSDSKGIQVFDTNGRYLDVFTIERNEAFGMVFNDKNELFIAARTQIVKFALNK